MWVDKDCNQSEESKAHGRKATHVLTRPNMVICVVKVVGDTSQIGDSDVGGQK